MVTLIFSLLYFIFTRTYILTGVFRNPEKIKVFVDIKLIPELYQIVVCLSSSDLPTLM